ncbi:MAG: hypothetical protein H0T76_08245 [Nannocystis sp.]|nr:hypothetical protein [Nannocystis sp.]
MMRTIRPSLLVLSLLAPSVAVPACTGSDRCVTIVDQQIACAPAEQRSHLKEARERTLAACRSQSGSDPAAEQEALACAEKRSCDEVRRCSDAIKDRNYAQEVVREIEAALATGERREEALSTCHFIELKDTDVKQRCGQLFAQMLASAMLELEGIRDKGGAPEGRCFDLGMTAERVSADAKARAEALCKEVDAAARAKAAIAEARKNIDTRTHEVPFRCGTAVEELERIDNDWSRARLAEVTRACYVELGASLLPAVVPTMQYTCEFHVGQVFAAVRKFQLADPRLDPWIAKAAAKCGDSPPVE